MSRRLPIALVLFAGFLGGYLAASIAGHRSVGSPHFSGGQQYRVNYPHPSPAFSHQRVTATITFCGENEDTPDAAQRWEFTLGDRQMLARAAD